MSEEIVCPECGGAVSGDLTCHTWPGPERDDGSIVWMACQGCGSATEYWCRNDACDWYYTYGLNSGNPRSEANETRRPDWIPDGHDQELVLPGPHTWWGGYDD